MHGQHALSGSGSGSAWPWATNWVYLPCTDTVSACTSDVKHAQQGSFQKDEHSSCPPPFPHTDTGITHLACSPNADRRQLVTCLPAEWSGGEESGDERRRRKHKRHHREKRTKRDREPRAASEEMFMPVGSPGQERGR